MFEEVVELHDKYNKYIMNQDYELQHAQSSLNLFFDHKLRKFEVEVTQKSHEQLKSEFDEINVPLDHKKCLLNAMNDAHSGYSIPAIDNLRKYIDHSLIEIAQVDDANYSTHNSLIPLSSMHIRLGNLDEGLISLIECIKLAQNKKDNQGIIKCLIWLQEIVKAFGNIEQAEMLILEQILIQ